MKVEIRRRWFTEESTIGEVYIDGKYVAFSLEDRVRSGPKVKAKTAIPLGKYTVKWVLSPRFQKYTWRILGVLGFTGILFHAGNTAADTEGCILLGMEKGVNCIKRSREAVSLFESLLPTDQEHSLKIVAVVPAG